jgi:hypothetical protein
VYLGGGGKRILVFGAEGLVLRGGGGRGVVGAIGQLELVLWWVVVGSGTS